MKISILTPSFNSSRYIARAIESVLLQDYKNWEHIIMDGGSTDDTITILKRYPHLLWVSEPDAGQSDAMNKAFEKSTGDIIIYLNADDEFAAGLLSKIVTLFSENPSVDMLIGNLQINAMGNVSIRKPSTSLITILDSWPAKFPLNPVSYAYKRNLQKRIGLFPVDNHYSMDYWFLLRAYLMGKLLKYEMICGTYHVDGTNKSADLTRGKIKLREVRNAFIKRYFYRFPVAIYILKNTLRKAAKLFLGKATVNQKSKV